MKTTVICHFYNEEKLLPQWLSLHREIFDFGVMINYNSTDNSVKIIQKMVPHWEITDSRNAYFDAVECDKEVMDWEEKFAGWKMALNVTEFLLCDNLKAHLQKKEEETPNLLALKCEAIMPYDRPEELDKKLNYHIPIWEQRTWGIVSSVVQGNNYWCAKNRIIHRAKHGRYTTGRHNSGLTKYFDPDLFLFCVSEGLVNSKAERNKQIGPRIPQSDLDQYYGTEHTWEYERVLQRYNANKHLCVELNTFPKYQEAIQKVKKFNLPIPLL